MPDSPDPVLSSPRPSAALPRPHALYSSVPSGVGAVPPGIKPEFSVSRSSVSGMAVPPPAIPVDTTASRIPNDSPGDTTIGAALEQLRRRSESSYEGRPACDNCRRRKSKCDRQQPVCGRCAKLNRVCTSTDILMRRGPPSNKERAAYQAAGLEMPSLKHRYRTRRARHWAQYHQHQKNTLSMGSPSGRTMQTPLCDDSPPVHLPDLGNNMLHMVDPDGANLPLRPRCASDQLVGATASSGPEVRSDATAREAPMGFVGHNTPDRIPPTTYIAGRGSLQAGCPSWPREDSKQRHSYPFYPCPFDPLNRYSPNVNSFGQPHSGWSVMPGMGRNIVASPPAMNAAARVFESRPSFPSLPVYGDRGFLTPGPSDSFFPFARMSHRGPGTDVHTSAASAGEPSIASPASTGSGGPVGSVSALDSTACGLVAPDVKQDGLYGDPLKQDYDAYPPPCGAPEGLPPPMSSFASMNPATAPSGATRGQHPWELSDTPWMGSNSYAPHPHRTHVLPSQLSDCAPGYQGEQKPQPGSSGLSDEWSSDRQYHLLHHSVPGTLTGQGPDPLAASFKRGSRQTTLSTDSS